MVWYFKTGSMWFSDEDVIFAEFAFGPGDFDTVISIAGERPKLFRILSPYGYVF